MASSTTTTSAKRTPKKRKSKMSRRTAGPAAQRSEILNHGLLTREQDFDLGEKIQRANQLKQTIAQYLDQKAVSTTLYDDRTATGSAVTGEPIEESILYAAGTPTQDSDFEGDLHNLSVYSQSSDYVQSFFDQEYDATTTMSEDFLFHLDHSQNRRQLYTSRQRLEDDDFDAFSQLTDEDIAHGLQLNTGRSDLQTILVEGAIARNTLISSNTRLVTSIAKKWSRNFDGVGGDNKLSQLYAGSSTRPSLDEAIQEGIVGLATAADRYDPSRKLRFSTYATYYITNSVRIAFQQASTNGLRVPARYHDIKAKYKRVLRQCLESNTPVPSEKDMAEQVGVTLNRLQKALVYARPCVSLDAPLSESGGPSKGSSAGEGSGDQQILLSDLMECQDEKNHPEQQVELSLLRQCLETAMACELSPHERDVVRLRLGLDDGVARTTRQVMEVLGGSCSMPDVRSAEKRAYSKLSSPFSVHARQLLSYLDFCGGDLETIR